MKFTTSAKKISAVITAALAAVALAPMTAMAAPTSGTDVADSTLTVNDLLNGDTVSAYQIADADIDAHNNLTYHFVSGLPAEYDSADELSHVATDGTSFKQDSAMQNAAAKIATAMTGKAAYTSATAQGTSATLTLGSGYYLVRVTSTSGKTRVYQNMVIDATPQTVPGAQRYETRRLDPINVKKTDVNVTKTVDEGESSTDKHSVGDSVPFTVSTAVPSYPADSANATFIIGDKPTEGLEIDPESIEINGQKAVSGLITLSPLPPTPSRSSTRRLISWPIRGTPSPLPTRPR